MKREKRGNSRRFRYLCLALFLLYMIFLIGDSLIQAYSKPIIGGASAPTVLFAFRQTVLSRKGVFTSCIGLPALGLFLILSIRDSRRKRKNRCDSVQT